MKKLLFLLIPLCLLVYASATADVTCVVVGGHVGGGESECEGYLVCQNLEAPGYDNSETWYETDGYGATITEACDSGTVDCPLRGTYSLYIVNNTGANQGVSTVISSSSAVYAHFLFQVYDFPTDVVNNLFAIYDDYPASYCDASESPYSCCTGQEAGTCSGNLLAKLMLGSDGSLYIQATGGSSSNLGQLTEGTDYHIWVDWVASTGVVTLYVDIDTTKAGAASTSSDGTDSANNAQVITFAAGYGSDHIYDQIYIKTTAFTTVPE